MAKLKCTPVPSGAPSIAGLSPSTEIDLSAGDIPDGPTEPSGVTSASRHAQKPDKWAKYEEKPVDPYACIAEPIDPPISAVNKSGLKALHWTRDLNVAAIETDDGQTLYPTPAPAGWTYLLIAFCPVLGFLIPWGLVRAIGWVGAGFVASPK